MTSVGYVNRSQLLVLHYVANRLCDGSLAPRDEANGFTAPDVVMQEYFFEDLVHLKFWICCSSSLILRRLVK